MGTKQLDTTNVTDASVFAPMKIDFAAAHRTFDYALQAIADLKESLGTEFIRAVETILAARGRVIVSGMGKSGHVGRKIAASMASTGTPAYFVHPAEASHGDMGEVTASDVLLMLSWGGETAELFNLITYAKRFAIPLIGMASNAQSTLLRSADIPLLLPKVREACPMGMAPTTSTTMMMALGDALTVTLMELRGFTPDRYRDFHPGGSLGRALVRVSDLMHSQNMPLVPEDTPIQIMLLKMAEGRMGCVGIVGADGGLLGIVTDGDLRRHFADNLADRAARDIMTLQPKSIEPDKLAAEALAKMNKNNITQLFVIDNNDQRRVPLGILHIHDCLAAGLK